MPANTYIAIMAGGVGSRFWPASRENRPKQFLDITASGQSLLQATFKRFLKITAAENIFIVTNQQYAQQVQEQLPEIGPHQILQEPSRNNTAPCVAYTAFKLLALDPLANFVIAPSDALIHNEAIFVENIRKALLYTAQHDALLTLGIAPTSPHTGYGYIQFDTAGQDGIYPVRRFTEKPDISTAKSFLASGDYLWNAGIFVWRASSILAAYQKHAPEVYELLAKGIEHYNTDSEQAFINEFYPQTPNISVDYAIMEKANNIFVLPAQFSWSDLGAWEALYQESPKNTQGNVVNTHQAILIDTHNSLIRVPQDKLVIVGGVNDLLIIDEGDVLMIYPKEREQEVKVLRKQAEEQFGNRYI